MDAVEEGRSHSRGPRHRRQRRRERAVRKDPHASDRTVFARATWGPARLVTANSVTTVRVGDGKAVTLTYSGLRADGADAQGLVVQGVPVLLDGQRAATAIATMWQMRIFFKPGRIRLEGGPSTFLTPGLHLKGHLLAQRLTLADDDGPLVWSRPITGALNLRTGPLLLVPPKVSPRAIPEHIALWVAAYRHFETAY